MTATTILQPPALDYDAMMKKRFQSEVSPKGRLERRIVWNLFAALEKAGFKPIEVNDGIGNAVSDAKAAMELIFNLDDCCVFFEKENAKSTPWVRLVSGNGVDIVSDWAVHRVPNGFDEALDAFNPEDYA